MILYPYPDNKYTAKPSCRIHKLALANPVEGLNKILYISPKLEGLESSDAGRRCLIDTCTPLVCPL